MKKGAILLVVLINALISFGQKEKPTNLPKFDQRKYHFGFLLSFNSATYYIDRKDDYTFSDSILNIKLDRQPGFNLNIVASWNPSPNLNLRFTPGLDFQERQLNYLVKINDTTSKSYLKKVESTYLTFPLLLKFRTNRINNFAAYALGGGYYAMDMANNRDLENNGPLEQLTVKTKKFDYGYTVGGGFDFFLMYFKFGIELKFNVGMRNILDQDNTYFANPLESIKTGSWTFSFTFEG
ncbi:MAG: hypothetical protein RL737_1504 [Bacteroidota bacterium]|jgi:hypothetical protein